MTDEELMKRLRKADEYEPLGHDGWAAADRIEALVKDRDEGAKDYCALMDRYDALFVRAERLEAALRRLLIAADGESYAEYFSAIEDGHATLKGADHD